MIKHRIEGPAVELGLVIRGPTEGGTREREWDVGSRKTAVHSSLNMKIIDCLHNHSRPWPSASQIPAGTPIFGVGGPLFLLADSKHGLHRRHRSSYRPARIFFGNVQCRCCNSNWVLHVTAGKLSFPQTRQIFYRCRICR